MNIFYLDSSPLKAAQYHCDKHVVKMILESVQILSTVAHSYGIDAPYKPTHQNHPSVVWAKESRWHIDWVVSLAAQLNEEHHYRYKPRDHASYTKLVQAKYFSELQSVMPNKPFTPPPQCMPEEFRCDNTVEAYRRYYAGGKQHLHSWTKRGEPDWLAAMLNK